MHMHTITDRDEKYFKHSLEQLRIAQKEVSIFCGSMSHIGISVVYEGSFCPGERLYNAYECMFGTDLNNVSLDNFKDVVKPVLEKAFHQGRVSNIFTDCKIFSYREHIDKWFFALVNYFNERAHCYWRDVMVAAPKYGGLSTLFLPSTVIHGQFVETFPTINKWQGRWFFWSTSKDPSESGKYPSYRGGPTIDPVFMKTVVRSLDPEKRMLWDAAENKRDEKVRMLQDIPGYDRDMDIEDMRSLRRLHLHQRTDELDKLSALVRIARVGNNRKIQRECHEVSLGYSKF
jgi:hypothetical protein